MCVSHLQKFPSMEDSTAMTIEFLRARLLSERSISRRAKLRADELEKKVIELEEQLRLVTLQKKMAEKATADVLAILENQGISDVSEVFDLGSDLEIHGESGMSNDYAKEGERSMSSKGRRHGSDKLSGSDVDSSPVSTRSLSRNGHHDSPCSLEKYKCSNSRRQSSFSSIGYSPKHRLGKSCRKIRHRRTRSVVESRDESVNVNCQENEVMSSYEGFPNCSDGGSIIPIIESKIQEEDVSEVNLSNKNHHINGYGGEKDMEKALEQQGQLLDQYEAMETTQRVWEETFRENNSATPDLCDPGNHSDMTEEKYKSKAHFPCSTKVVNSNAQEDKAEPAGVLLSQEIFKAEVPKTFDDTGGYNNQKSATFSTVDVVGRDNSLSVLSGSQNESSIKCHCQASDKHHQDQHRHGYPDSKPSFLTDVCGGLDQEDASRNNNDLYALVSYDQSHKFSGVLESLKQARVSLQKELNRLSLVKSGYNSKAINPSAFVSKSEDRFVIPAGCPGLFRLPTDFSDEAITRSNVHDSTSPNFYVDRFICRTYDAQFGTNPHSGTMLRLPANDQSLATLPSLYLENESRLDSKMFPFGKYMYPMFPIYPLYQNAAPQMPFDDGLSRPYSSRHSWGSSCM